MRVLVTGSAGFIGSHLCERLLADGHHVTGVDALTDSYDPAIKRNNLQRLLATPGFSFLPSDLLALDTPVVQEAEIVFHLAARPGVRSSWGPGFEDYLRANVLGTQHLLEAATQSGVRRMVYSSSSSIYGNIAEERVTEEHPRAPISPYGVTKLAGEQLCFAYVAASDLEVFALRLFTVYGPRQRPDMAFHRLIHAALTGEKFVLFGDGEQQRDFTFVADVVEALILAAKAESAGGAFNIAGGGIASMNQAIALVEDLAGVHVDIERASPQSGDVKRTAADLTKSRDVLGYSPQVQLRDGLRAEIQWMEQSLLFAAASTDM